MKQFFSSRGWKFGYAILLAAFTAFVLLDTFVIPHSYSLVADSGAETSAGSSQTAENLTDAAVSENSYDNRNVKISITTCRKYDTDLYIADIQASSAENLRTALADSTYGRNITETTSTIAKSCGAVLAVNGDYYGAQRSGYVIRNGVLYRSESAGSDQEDLVIRADGSFELVTEGSVTAEELEAEGAWQVLSFGPGLLLNGAIAVDTGTEVDKARTSNPRTAIGEISPLHDVLVVADGRTDQSAGLSLYELAEVMQSLGVQTAYNLDGGGSSTLYFNGEVLNNPTSDGRKIREREVSDIVYIGF